MARMSVNDAAIVLGLTPGGVRQRLRRGNLQGEKINDEWIVFLDDDITRDTVAATRETVSTSAEDARVQLEEVTSLLDRLYKERLEAMEQHIEDLRSQLRVKDEQLSEKDKQLQTVNLTLIEWTRRVPEPKAIPNFHGKPWWKFWSKY